jgi:predicted DNA-binding protein
MVTITCKIPEELNERLEAEASRRMLPKSALVREALNRSITKPREARKQTAFDAVKNLCGIIKDGPADMSTNPKYMDGFGR